MNMLEIENVQFAYGRGLPALLNGVTLHASAGESFLVIGDNGAGKTTLNKVCSGLLRPVSGTVKVDGRDVHALSIAKRPALVMYMGQVSYLQFFRSSVREEIDFARKVSGSTQLDVPAAYRALSLPEDDSLKPMDLGYPEMWRLQLLLLSLVFSPSVLFIDEIVAPNSRVQRNALDYVLEYRKAHGQVTFISYQRNLHWPFSRTVMLQDGQLFSDRGEPC